MRNYEGIAYHPTYFCLKDKNIGLLWVIPMSSRVDKYQPIMEKNITRYGECLKIVIGEYGSFKAVFLLQNIFPSCPNT
jgi:hypothetical protein